MSEKYDLIFGMGSTPITAVLLKKLNLQIYDFPFDFISGGDFYTRMNLLLSGCKDFISKQCLKNIGKNPITQKDQYQDIKTNFIYAYDFNPELPIENTFPSARARYKKYIRNLYLLIKHSKKILLVYVEDPTHPEEGNESLIIEASAKLKQLFPKSDINFLYAKNDTDAENMKVIKINNNAYKFMFKFYGQFAEGVSPMIDESMLSVIFADIELKKDWAKKKMFFIKKLISFLDKFISKHQ